MPSALFSPIKLAGVELDNRIVVSPMCQYSADDGCASDWHIAHLGMLANSGAGLLVVEATHVERHGRITHGCLGLYSDACEDALAHIVAHCRRIGTAKLGIQLAHAGRKASAQRPWEGAKPLSPSEDPWPTIAPSAVPFGSGWHTPHANKRNDEFGGSFEGRMRFPLQVVRDTRAVVPRGIPLGARITGTDWVDGGLTADDAVAMAKALKAAGIDYVDISSANITPKSRWPNEPGFNVPIAERVRRETGLPVRVVGMIVNAKQAEAIIAEGKADMIAMARAFLDDPHWAWHAAQILGAEVARPPQYQRVGPALWPGAALRG